MTDKFQKSIELSYALYDEKSILRCQHFCFIWYKDRVISIGLNNKKTNPTNFYNRKIRNGNDYTEFSGTCAELNSFIKLRNKTRILTEKCIMINTRINRNKELDYSKPCISCSNLIQYLSFKGVFFTNKLGSFEKFSLDN